MVGGGGSYRFDALEELVESAVGVAGEEDARRRRGRRGGGHWGWVLDFEVARRRGHSEKLRIYKSFGPVSLCAYSNWARLPALCTQI
jgi:hypothetical protein